MQAFGFIFLKRKWEEDSVHVENSLTYYAKQNYPLQLLLFPEGTDFTESSKTISQNFAKKNGNMEPFQFVLFPRFKAWQSSVQILTNSSFSPNGTVDHIFDVTIGYPDSIPQNEKFLFTGKLPKEIHFNIKKYNIKDVLSAKDKQGIQIGEERIDGVSQWCLDR